MKVKTLKVTLNRSTKMADYQFYKTGIELEVDLTNTEARKLEESTNELYNKANDLLNEMVQRECEYKATEEEINELREIVRTSKVGSMTNKLAKDKLKLFGAETFINQIRI